LLIKKYEILDNIKKYRINPLLEIFEFIAAVNGVITDKPLGDQPLWLFDI
jgi:hypothetical protein